MQPTKLYDTKECANSQCNKEFQATRPNMIYCSQDCGRKVANAKLLEKYHSNQQKKNEVRRCECGTVLSKYNDDDQCHACLLRQEHMKRKAILARLGIKYEDEEFD